jgi:serine/threonine protein kinase
MYPEWYEGEVVTNALVYFEYERESHCRSVDILWSLLVAATSIIVLCVLRAKELFSERPPTIKNVYIHKTGSKEMVVEKSSTLIIQTEIKRISARNSVYQGTFGKHKVVMKVLLSDEMGSTEMKVAELLPISSPYVIRHMFTMTTSTKILVVYGMKDRGDLASLTSGIGLSTVRAIKYIRDAEKGLKDLHDIGVIHGDIRAENLLLGQNYGDEEHGHGEHEDDVVSICDFDHSYIEGLKNGIKFMERRARREPNWLAPEIILDSSSIPTKKTDFYSLGATLYEIYTGKIPWKGKTYVDIVNIARDGRAILTGNVIIDEEINRFVNM